MTTENERATGRKRRVMRAATVFTGVTGLAAGGVVAEAALPAARAFAGTNGQQVGVCFSGVFPASSMSISGPNQNGTKEHTKFRALDTLPHPTSECWYIPGWWWKGKTTLKVKYGSDVLTATSNIPKSYPTNVMYFVEIQS